MKKAEYKPEGLQFKCHNHGDVIFIQKGPWTGWIAKKHPDGHWVTVRMANAVDLQIIARIIAILN